MITREEAATYFRQLIGSKASWAKLASSQFVGHLSVFVSWCLREALWRLERLHQEFFISTALNDSSIMAHAEDREYIPRKRIPASGTATISNDGSAVLSLPVYAEFQSPDSITYLTTSGVSVAPGASEVVQVSQIELETVDITVTQSTAFYTILLSKDQSQRLSSFSVDVDEDATGEYVEWSYSRLFQNSFTNSRVYDEFFNHSGQTGIRFGNGAFGKIPPQGSKIRIRLTLTEGDTSLVAGQALSAVDEVVDQAGNLAQFSATVSSAIDGGSERESVSEMKSNLHYWPTYNGKLVWDEDYAFFVKRSVEGITWVKCWGEGEQEAETGFSVHNINRIFITAYAPESISDISSVVMNKLSEVRLLNRNFQWVEPVHSTFSVSITGKVARVINTSTTISSILSLLESAYGKDSIDRKPGVFISEIYEIINETGLFSDGVSRFQVTVSGKTEPTELAEMISIDMATTTVVLAYV